MIGCNTYTKVTIKLEVKDFPYGRVLKFHFWLDGFVEKDKINNYIENEFHFDLEDVSENDVSRCYIEKIIYTSDRSEKEGFGNVIFDSSVVIIPDSKERNTKGRPTKPKNIVMHDVPTDELIELRNKIEVELLKRQYFLSDEEYQFYSINKDTIDVSNVKDMFKEYKGDAFKIRKMNIRNILSQKTPLIT